MQATEAADTIGNILEKRKALGKLWGEMEKSNPTHWLVKDYGKTRITAFLKGSDADAIIERLTDDERRQLVELAGAKRPAAVPPRPTMTSPPPLPKQAPTGPITEYFAAEEEEREAEENDKQIPGTEEEPGPLSVAIPPVREAAPKIPVCDADRKGCQVVPSYLKEAEKFIDPKPLIEMKTGPGLETAGDLMKRALQLLEHQQSFNPDAVRAIVQEELGKSTRASASLVVHQAEKPPVELEGLHHFIFPLVVAASAAGVPVMLVGKAGVGKTKMIVEAKRFAPEGAEFAEHRDYQSIRDAGSWILDRFFVVEVIRDEGLEAALMGIESDSVPFSLDSGGVPSPEEWLALVNAARINLDKSVRDTTISMRSAMMGAQLASVRGTTISMRSAMMGAQLASVGVGRNWLFTGLIAKGLAPDEYALVQTLR